MNSGTSHPVENAEYHFLVEEYYAVWKEAGLDEVPRVKLLPVSLRNPAPAPVTVRPPEVAKSFATSLPDLKMALSTCRRCALSEGRQQVVFGVGHSHAPLMFVGEGPGQQEDSQGTPFLGEAGALLNKIIQAMGLTRDSVYLTDVIKCRPFITRPAREGELAECSEFLRQQIQLIRPKIVVALGDSPASALIGKPAPVAHSRGQFHSLTWNAEILVMATYPPKSLLQNPELKRLVWDDMKLVKNKLGGAL